MIDLHCHILPGLDDGSENMEQTIRMAEMAEQDGVHFIVATPHYRRDAKDASAERIREKVKEVNNVLERRGISLRVLPGMEPQIQFDFVEKVKDGTLLTLNATGKYILLELPFHQPLHQLDRMIFDMQMAGYTPIIPHPERTDLFRTRPKLLYDLVKKGVLTQINAGSITGQFGKRVKGFAMLLLETHLAHLVASDAHDDLRRPPLLSTAYKEIFRIAGEETVYRMKENAKTVAMGKDFWVGEPVRP